MPAALARRLPPDEDDDPRQGRMAFLAHLEELRTRLVRSAVAIGVGMLIAFAAIDRIVAFVLAPTRRMLPPGVRLIYTQPGEAFGFYIEIAMLAGAVIASPYVAYQLWRFIAPALYVKEKRLVIPFVLLSTSGVVGGAAFSHAFVFPYMIAFFGTFHSASLTFMPQLTDVFSLYVTMMLGMVGVFQIPTIVYFLARMNVITASFLWRHFRYAILAAFIISAVATPTTDPWDQFVFAAPMIVLYLLSIGIAWAVRPRRTE